MAMSAYLLLRSGRAGLIRGSVTRAGYEGLIEIIGAEHVRSRAVTSTTGLTAATFKCEPLVLTKEIDKSSPVLLDANARRDTMSEFVLSFYRPVVSAGMSPSENYFTIRLTNAKIVSLRTELLNVQFPDNERHGEREVISFAYDSMEFVWNDGGVSHSHTWVAPSAVAP